MLHEKETTTIIEFTTIVSKFKKEKKLQNYNNRLCISNQKHRIEVKKISHYMVLFEFTYLALLHQEKRNTWNIN